MAGKKVSLSQQSFIESGSRMNQLRVEKKFCDIVIKVGKKHFECHRVVLISRSSYFRGQLSENFSGNGNEIRVSCLGFNEDHFELALNYLYGSDVVINANNIYPLLKLSDLLLIESLEDFCIEFIGVADTIPLEITISIVSFAANHCKQKLLSVVDSATLGFLAQNFKDVLKDKEFQLFPMDVFLKILAHPNFHNVASISSKFFSKWMVNHYNEAVSSELCSALASKQISLDVIMKMCANVAKHAHCISLHRSEESTSDSTIGSSPKPIAENDSVAEMSVESTHIDEEDYFRLEDLPFLLFTHDEVQNIEQPRINTYRLVKRTQDNYYRRFMANHYSGKFLDCESVFIENLCFTMVHKAAETDRGKPAKAKTFSLTQTPCVSTAPEASNFELYIYNDDSEKLRQLKVPPPKYTTGVEFKNIIMTAINTDIYLHTNAGFLKYDSTRDEWMQLPPFGYKNVISPSLLSYADFNGTPTLYLVGGRPSDFINDKLLIQRFDAREGKWLELLENQSSKCRCQSACCISDNTLYISGGDNVAYYGYGNYVECYDIRAGKWDIFASKMPGPKMNHHLLSYDNKLWFFGGEKYSNTGSDTFPDLTWYFYDLQQKTWSDIFYISEIYSKQLLTTRILDVIKSEHV